MELIELAFLVLLGVAALAVVARGGALRARALDATPPRAVDLNIVDVCIAFVLLFLGAMAVGGVLPALGIPATLPAVGAPMDPRREALRALLGQAFTQGPVAVFVLLRVRGRRGEAGLVPRDARAEVRAGGRALLVTIPMVFATSALTEMIAKLVGAQTPRFGHEMLYVLSQSRSPVDIAATLASAIAIAPVLEEVIFRGLLQTALLNALGRSHRWWVVVLGAAIFAGSHLGSASWQTLPALFVLGVVLGWLFEKHGSLLPSVLLHAGFNAFNTLLTLFFAVSAPAPWLRQ